MNKFDEITEDIDEIIGEEYIKEILERRNLKIYWGTTPSSLLHIFHIIPLLQIKKFIKCGCEVKILLADIHAYLDLVNKSYDNNNDSNESIKFEILAHRRDIHENLIKYLIRYLEIDSHNIKFVQGTSYQTREEYTLDMYKFNALCKISQLKKAGEKILLHNNDTDPLMTTLLYPTLQALDIEYLDTDVFYGDSQQKDICILANTVLEKMGYKKKGYLLNDIYINLKSMKKITMIDTYEKISHKIYEMKMQDVLYLLDNIIFEICIIKDIMLKICSTKNENDDNNNIYYFNNIEDLSKKYKSKEILLFDIKTGVIDFLEDLIEPIRTEFLSTPDLIEKLIDAKYY
jgi:tyrosyl-tRNA synthetase